VTYKEVTIRKVVAKDGSLHDTPEQAKAYDSYRRHADRLERVEEIISTGAWTDYNLSPFCGYDCEDDYDRNSRLEAIAEIVIGKWDDLKSAMWS